MSGNGKRDYPAPHGTPHIDDVCMTNGLPEGDSGKPIRQQTAPSKEIRGGIRTD